MVLCFQSSSTSSLSASFTNSGAPSPMVSKERGRSNERKHTRCCRGWLDTNIFMPFFFVIVFGCLDTWGDEEF